MCLICVLYVLLMSYNAEKIRHAYKSKYNLKRQNQVSLLIITDGEKWHYLAVEKFSVLFRGTTSNDNGEFYQLCSCYVEMPKEDNEILRCRKFHEGPLIIYAD